jgi:type I restriction enzyme, S subunit
LDISFETFDGNLKQFSESNWEIKELQDAAKIIDSCHKTPVYLEYGLAMIRAGDVKEGYLNLKNTVKVSKEVYEEFTRNHSPQINDIVMSRVGTYFVTSFVNTEQPFCLGQNTVVIHSEYNSKFLYYVLISPIVKRQIEQLLVGSGGQETLSLKNIRELKIPYPPLIEQEVIQRTLSSLDDKIELNQRMNQTLEAICQAVFRRWFVDFEFPNHEGKPYKSSGGKMVNSDLGEIPQTWEIKSIGDVLDLAYGKPLKEPNRQAGTIPVFGSNGQIGWHDKKLVNGTGIIVGRKGNPGTVLWSETDFFPIDTTFYVVPKEVTKSLYYLFYLLRSQNLPLLSADSAVPGLNRNIAYMNNILIPPSDTLSQFDKIISELFLKIHRNKEQITTLFQIRDLLLPKLISGQVRVPIYNISNSGSSNE